MRLSSPARLVVLVSGVGSNLQAVIDACRNGRLNASIAAVVSNRREAHGLTRARQAGIPAVYLPRPRHMEPREYDRHLANQVESYRPAWIILAGWMRLLSSVFLDRFQNRVINLHPALPGAFPGTKAIARAYQAFQHGSITRTGVMVHLVPDEGVDCGPVLCQETVQIWPGETLGELEQRIHAVEHRLLVEALSQIISSS